MWFQREASHLLACDASASPLEIFTSALLRSLLSQSPLSTFPETFYLDAERIRALRNDLFNHIQLDICCDLFELLVQNKVNSAARGSIRNTVRTCITDIVGENRRFTENASNIAAEIVRSALQLENAAICYNSELADFVEKQLRNDLQTSSMVFSTRIQDLMDENLPHLIAEFKTNSKLTILTLHEVMLSPANSYTANTPDTVEKLALYEIFRRATHLGVLHWHIWSPMVYNIQENESGPVSSDMPDDGQDGNPDAIASNSPGLMTKNFISEIVTHTADFLAHSSEPSGSSVLQGRPPQ